MKGWFSGLNGEICYRDCPEHFVKEKKGKTDKFQAHRRNGMCVRMDSGLFYYKTKKKDQRKYITKLCYKLLRLPSVGVG